MAKRSVFAPEDPSEANNRSRSPACARPTCQSRPVARPRLVRARPKVCTGHVLHVGIYSAFASEEPSDANSRSWGPACTLGVGGSGVGFELWALGFGCLGVGVEGL